jgi:hypothetical protein
MALPSGTLVQHTYLGLSVPLDIDLILAPGPYLPLDCYARPAPAAAFQTPLHKVGCYSKALSFSHATTVGGLLHCLLCALALL